MALGLVNLNIEYYPDPTQGRPVFNGSIYVGEPDLDPVIEANRLTVQIRQEGNLDVPILPASQPLLTGSGGVILYNGSPAQLLVEGNYSLKVVNSSGAQVYYVANAFAEVVSNTTNAIVVEDKAEANALNIVDGKKVFITSPDGGDFTMRAGAAIGTYNDDGAGFTGTQFTSGDGSSGLKRDFEGAFNVRWFGAKGDYSWTTKLGTDDTVVIQRVMDLVGIDGGGTIYLPDGIYLVSELTNIHNNVTMVGSNESYQYENNGFILVNDKLEDKFKCILMCNTGVFCLHAKFTAADRGMQFSISNIAVWSETGVEYGVVISTGMSTMRDMAVSGFDYGVATFTQNSNLYDRLALLNNRYIGMVMSDPGTGLSLASFQHPNLAPFLESTIFLSTIYKITNCVFRGNGTIDGADNVTGGFALVIMSGSHNTISNCVFEFNLMGAILLYNHNNGDVVDSLVFQNDWFEGNYNGYITRSSASQYSITPLTPLLSSTSPSKYLEGTVHGEWTNNDSGFFDVATDIWIGSELESTAIGDIGSSPKNIQFKNCNWGSLSSKGKMLYLRSCENVSFQDQKCNNGDADLLIKIDGVYGRHTKLTNFLFYGASGISFDTNYFENGALGGAGNYISRIESGTDKVGGSKILQGSDTELIRTLPITDGTPSVKKGKYWKTSDTTGMNDFDDGTEGQVIVILAEHVMTVVNGTNIFLDGDIDFDMVDGCTLTLLNKADGFWYELSRSNVGSPAQSTWSPVLEDASSNPLTLDGQVFGGWTRIGNMVTLTGRIGTTALAAASGALRISGVPFPCAAINSGFYSGIIGFGDSLTVLAGENISMYIAPNTSVLTLHLWSTTGGSTALATANWNAGSSITFTITYKAA